MSPKQYAIYTIRAVKEYSKKPYKDKVKLIIDSIEADICDRRGLKHEWQSIDKKTIKEIKNTWVEIVKEALKDKT